MIVNMTINGKKTEIQCDADTMLLEALREAGYKSVKCGCETTNCGLCTVWLEGKPVLSCSVPAARCSNKNVTTLEGVSEEVEIIGSLLVDEGADQCGFCSPGLLMNIIAMKKELKKPTEEEIKHYLAGNLCRCTGYMAQLRAVKKYLEVE